jgi:RimK family alpha-L-glutamate ligase
MKKVLLLSQSDPNTYEIERLKEQFEKKGHSFTHQFYSNIEISFLNSHIEILVNKINVLEYDIFLFRSSKSSHGYYYGHYTGIMKEILMNADKKILNLYTTKHFDNWATKLYTYTLLADQGIPLIKTYNFATFKQVLENKNKLDYPLIAKLVRGSHGDGVTLIHNFEELYDYFITNPPATVLLQEYINSDSDIKEDLRVITLGYNVIGGYKKVAPKGSIITNLASGGNTEKVDLSKETIAAAKKIAEIMKADFTGIDFIIREGVPYVLEVNRAPQFQGFEKTTGINLSEEIVNFLTTDIS